MKTPLMVAVALCGFCAGCGVFGGDATPAAPAVEFAPAPLGETAAAVDEPSDEPVEPITLSSDTAFEAGRVAGDVVLAGPRLVVTGAGAVATVIDGNLTVASQCQVRDLTVTGDLIFAGNNARAIGVRCLGQVLDYGVCNRH